MPLMRTVCFLSERSELNQERAVSEMPKVCWSLVRRIVWSMVSKAAERSRSVRRETLPESVARRRSLRMWSKAVSVL